MNVPKIVVIFGEFENYGAVLLPSNGEPVLFQLILSFVHYMCNHMKVIHNCNRSPQIVDNVVVVLGHVVLVPHNSE